MAKRQSVGTTAVVRELANSLDKGSAKKSQASVAPADEFHHDQLLLRYRYLGVLCAQPELRTAALASRPLERAELVWVLHHLREK